MGCTILKVPQTLSELFEVCRAHKVANILINEAEISVTFDEIKEVQSPQPTTQPQLEVDPLFWSAQ